MAPSVSSMSKFQIMFPLKASEQYMYNNFDFECRFISRLLIFCFLYTVAIFKASERLRRSCNSTRGYFCLFSFVLFCYFLLFVVFNNIRGFKDVEEPSIQQETIFVKCYFCHLLLLFVIFFVIFKASKRLGRSCNSTRGYNSQFEKETPGCHC